MGKRYAVPLLRVFVLALNFLALSLPFFTEVTSMPIAERSLDSVTSVMINDTKLCNQSRFLYDSEYANECATSTYFVHGFDLELHVGTILCIGMYDTAYKICQYSSRHLIPANISAIFGMQMLQRLGKKAAAQKTEFCNDLRGYTTMYNKTDYLWEPLVQNINVPRVCEKICFDTDDKLQPLCAVLDWIKSIDDDILKEASKPGTRQGSVSGSGTGGSQLNDETTSDSKTIPAASRRLPEAKETKEQAPKPVVTATKDNDGVKVENVDNPNASGDLPLATTARADAPVETIELVTVKLGDDKDGIQKKINKTQVAQDHKSLAPSAADGEKGDIGIDPGAGAEVAKPAKNNPANSANPPAAPVNNLAGNAPSGDRADQGNAQEYEKPPVDVTGDVKTSTISENTQDHYDMIPEDVESNKADNIDDIDDAIPQPIDIGKEFPDGSQNDILQEVSGHKDNLQYTSARIDDESHFFTYFTVITVACIAGYIGYHNKQKILAIVLEGRRSRSGRGRRRPSTASYRKLDCTLEEAVTSQCNSNVTHVIY